MRGKRPLALFMSVALAASMAVLPASADEAPRPDGGGQLAEGVGAPPEGPQAPPADGPAQAAAPQRDPALQQDPEPDPAADAASPLGSAPVLNPLSAPLSSNQPGLLAAGEDKAKEFVSGKLRYRVIEPPTAVSGGKVAVVANWYTEKSYEIPRFVRHGGTGYAVTEVAEYAFAGCTPLESVVLPEGLKTIGASAFAGCTSLSSVTFPKGFETVGDSSFEGCTSLATATFLEGFKTVEDEAFAGCTSLSSVTFPKGFETVGDSSFEGCTSLASATFLEGLKTIGKEAFIGCTSLVSATFPVGLEVIGDYAFEGCTSLVSATFPEGLEDIGDYAFNGCEKLGTATLPESGEEPWTASFPESLKTIGKAAFSGCKGLEEAFFSEGLLTIGELAFQGCSLLATATFPKSLEAIGRSAFNYCESLVATFAGGTVKVGVGAFNDVSRVVVDGGSVAGADTFAGVQNPPTDSQGRPVYLAEVTLRLSDNANSTLAPLVELEDLDGNKIAYGLDLASTDDQGKAYLWLPEGAAIARVVAQAGADGSTRAYVPELGRSLTVAAGADNWAVFRAEQVALRAVMLGAAPPDAAPTFVDYEGRPISGAAQGQRIGLDVTALEDMGLRVAGLYLGGAAHGGGPVPGALAIEEDFARGYVNGKDVYWFFAPDSDAIVYCALAPAGEPDPVLEPRVLTGGLPGAVQGDFYYYRIAAAGPAGTTAEVSGLPEGMFAADGLLVFGTPQEGGSFEVRVELRAPGGEAVVETLPFEVWSGEPRSVSDGKGNSVTGFVPRDSELVVEGSPFGAGNVQAAAGALGWGAVEEAAGGTFRVAGASGATSTLVPVMASEAHLVMGGQKLPFSGTLEVGLRFAAFEAPAGFEQGARASLVALHAPEAGGVQAAESDVFGLSELASGLAGGIALSAAAGGMSGLVARADDNALEMRLSGSRSLSPFALYLKVEGEPAAPEPDPKPEPDPVPGSDSSGGDVPAKGAVLVRTGDAAPLAPAAALAAASGALLLAAALRRRRAR